MDTNWRMDGHFVGEAHPRRETPQHIAWPPHPPARGRRGNRRKSGITLLVAMPVLLVATFVGTLLAQASPSASARRMRGEALHVPAAPCATRITTVTFGGASITATTKSGAQAAQFATRVSANCAATVLLDFEVYNAKNSLVYQAWLSHAALASAAQTFTVVWTLPAKMPSGAYALDLGAFTTNWQQEFAWVNHAAIFTIASGRVLAATPTTTTPTTPPAPTHTPAPTTPTSTPTPPSAPNGGALAPGTTLPSEAACAAAIPSSTWEPRRDNTTANHSVPTASQIAGLAPWDGSMGLDPHADALQRSITGNYTGTTDQILQWVACKWGIDPNIVRAQAVAESSWHQNSLGDLTSNHVDCPLGAATSGGGCYQSYGILQVKWMYNQSAWPMSRDDTAFSAEYTYGMIRACYEGDMTWLGNGYKAGDIWGCLGFWYSGNWYSADAQTYVNSVKAHYNNQDWLSAGF